MAFSDGVGIVTVMRIDTALTCGVIERRTSTTRRATEDLPAQELSAGAQDRLGAAQSAGAAPEQPRAFNTTFL